MLRREKSFQPSAMNWTALALLPFLFLPASRAGAAAELVTISSEDKISAPRWIYGKEQKTKETDPTVLALASVKSAQMEGDSDACIKRIGAIRSKVKSLQAWLTVAEIDCASKAKPSSANADKLAQAIARAEANPAWLLKGPQAPLLRTTLVQGALALIEQDVKLNRSRSWKSIEDLQGLLPYMESKGRAKLWRSAGELAFIQQKPEAARDFLRRSLLEESSDETRARLASVESAIGAPKETTSSMKSSDTANAAVEASKDELELVDRVTVSLKAGDLVPAVEDSLKIITTYPGSSRAKWATDRALDVYLSMIDKNDSKYILLKDRIFKVMEKADGDRLADWARSMYSKGQYADSYSLSRRALDDMIGARRTAVLDLAAKAGLACDRFSEVQELSNELVTKNAGTKEAHEAMFRLGLISYRLGQYPQALASFEKVIAVPQAESQEVLARYWMWRSLQKMSSDRAASAADELMKRFPFTYYGLRARFESAGNVLEWKPEPFKAESKMWMTSTEHLGWERLQLLLRAGWLDEAQAELKNLPQPIRADDKAVRALFWAAAGQYINASKLVNEAWDEKAEFRSTPFVAAAFPSEFDAWITEQAKTRNLDRYLVKSLIKQESSYNARAISPSNAFGLMQVIAPTAKEIANDLRLGALDIPNDLFQPKKNILLGTHYLSRLITKYQGNVPLALAAYNAGPGRMDRWLRARPSLKNVTLTKSSAPDDEIWFDEIPYAETSFYVKAILRNLLIYKMLDQGRVQVKEPVWSFE